VEEAVAGWAREHDVADIVAALRPHRIAVAQVSSSRDLIENDPQLAHRRYWQHVEHPEVGPVLLSALPFTIDGERVQLERPPLFGEHTEAVLGGLLGFSDERIKALNELGALS